MLPSDVTVEVRDKNLVRKGVILGHDLDLEVSPILNGVGSWRLTLRRDHPMHDVLNTPCAGVVVYLHDGVFDSGFVNMPETEANSSNGADVTVFNGVLDNQTLWDRLAFPDPGSADPAAQGTDYDNQSGPLESVVYHYVSANLGPTAPAGRKHTKVTLAADGARGPVIQHSARFDNLGELVSGLATANQFVMTLKQSGDSLLFECAPPYDRTNDVQLSLYNSSLTSTKVATASPLVTHVISGAAEVNWDRAFREVTTTDSVAASNDWGRRIERFVDAQQADVNWDNPQPEAEDNAIALLKAEGTTTVTMQGVAADDTSYQFGRDWFVGDLVTLAVGSTVATVQITGATLLVDADGANLAITIGNSALLDPVSRLYSAVNNLSNQVSVEQRNPARITDGAITENLLSAPLQSTITSADGRNKIYHSPTQPVAPSEGFRIGDTWFNTSMDNQIAVWDGSTWVVANIGTDAIEPGSITTVTIADNAITNEKVADLGITVNKFNVGTHFLY